MHSVRGIVRPNLADLLELDEDVADRHSGSIPLTERPGLRLADDVQIVVPQLSS